MTPADLDRVRTLAGAVGFGEIVQVAIHAPNLEAAAAHWAQHGAGPFHLLEHVALTSCLYRGAPAAFDHSSAYGQMGDIMLELIHQHDDRPSAVRDMYDARTPGPHHAAIFVDDLDIAVSAATARGFPLALDAVSTAGLRFAMADARPACGVMLEFYEPSDALMKFYSFVRRKSVSWTGDEPLRKLSARDEQKGRGYVHSSTMDFGFKRGSRAADAVAELTGRSVTTIAQGIQTSI